MKVNFLKKSGLRLLQISAIGVLLVFAFILIILVLRNNTLYFYTPSMLKTTEIGKKIRVGGFVKQSESNGIVTDFVLSDCVAEINVRYEGILPELFTIDGDAVVEAIYENENQLIASKVLAKHDENYTPPELAKALKKQPCRFPQLQK